MAPARLGGFEFSLRRAQPGLDLLEAFFQREPALAHALSIG
jgi:hypothetical protein